MYDPKCLDCGAELSSAAIAAHLPGCMVMCASCMEAYQWRSLPGLIDFVPDDRKEFFRSLPPDYYSLANMLARASGPRNYPTHGIITEDDPSIWGSDVLGWEGETWESFNRRHDLQTTPECPDPYRRGIGSGFGNAEDGD